MNLKPIGPLQNSIRLLLEGDVFETVQGRGDVLSVLDHGRCRGVEAVRPVERDGVAGLAAAHDTRASDARDVHDPRDGGAVDAARGGASEGNHASTA